jgi:FtsP/CotA-like multicopper oxidase with cupredoxin domain
MTDNSPARPNVDLGRRRLLTAGGLSVAAVVLGGCTTQPVSPAPAGDSAGATSAGATTSAGRAAILAVEGRRVKSGRSVQYTLTPQHSQIDLGGVVVRTLAYGSTIPGPLIRANIGDELSVTVKNQLTDPTSMHSHGVAMRNDMDGVAPASKDIAAGGQFTYTYTVPHAGTYWSHPHVGIQTDYGLYAPIVFDDPNEKVAYDTEWIVVLDDWTDGVGKSPTQELADLQAGGSGMSMGSSTSSPAAGMPGMNMGSSPATTTASSGGMAMGGMGVGTSALLGGDAGDVKYPYYLINGRIPAAPVTFTAKAGQRVRIRIINAGADTAFRVALGGHVMTVTHTDGYPVVPQDVDALLIGMAERYDVVVTLKDGVFPLVALAEGKGGLARALVRTGSAQVPAAGVQPAQLQGRIGLATALLSAPDAALPAGTPDHQLTATLGGGMMPYQWTINGRGYDQTVPLQVRQGQRPRLTLSNQTDMWHPMHLHGHTFQLVRPDGRPGVRKDTVIVKPRTTMAVDLLADNPGVWMLHCHNGYHSESGMMTRLEYSL